jgi:hypothetical protein
LHEERLFQANAFYRVVSVTVKSPTHNTGKYEHSNNRALERTEHPAAPVFVPNNTYPLANARRGFSRPRIRPSEPFSHSMSRALAIAMEL